MVDNSTLKNHTNVGQYASNLPGIHAASPKKISSLCIGIAVMTSQKCCRELS
jgi:hypothetical protein